ncbi:response regulator [Methylobacter sp. S3L5C]|uniref:response regulator n=1 Tax=Methylobacter sp. S3L5C TaxID=2839024 RepID=UPI001FADA0F5|nr:response regulator [Methylobacter sp. S3L5C]UOA09142.1 response regulator [Methylobacter sp. S3L5C]
MNFKVTWVRSLTEALKKIAEARFDILILDLSLPDSQGLSTINLALKAADSAAIIVLIDYDEIGFALTTLQAGAKDYILKGDSGYEGLIRVMRNVLNRADMETRNPLLVAALEATANAIIITNKDAVIEWINMSFTVLTGYSFKEALGKRPAELLKSGVHDLTFYQKMWQKLDKREHWQGEITNKNKDGSLYVADVDISPVFNKNGSLSGYVEIQRDITDSVVRLAISKALQQNTPLNERFKQVMNIIFDIKLFNTERRGCVFLQAKDENYLTLFLLHGEFSKEFIEKENSTHCGSCLSEHAPVSGKIFVSDDCFCDPRPEHKFTNMNAHGHFIVPITYGDEVLGVLFLFTDPYPLQTENRLTMFKQVGELMGLALRQEEVKKDLETARDMAMQALLVKNGFLANMSHEIRTPMNGVLGMLDLLRETKMTPNQQDWLETAHSSGKILLEIINDILDLSKLEAGKFEVEQNDFNLIDLVEDICALLANRAHAKGLELNCSLPLSLSLSWRGDALRIRQVLTNLIGNAVKFTEHGEVSVSIIQTTTDGSNELRFEVRDTGIGISPEVQLCLFKPFTQADSSTSRRFGGSGLGLSISKQLIELMGGTIGVNSLQRTGSCFWFTLPLTESKSVEIAKSFYDFVNKRALIVDDNATNRNILGTYLKRWELEVSEVDNASAALMQLQTSALKGLTYDLILLDIQMPIMDGLTLAKCLAQIPTLAKIPIILLSSGDNLEPADYQGTSIVQRLLKPTRQSQLFDAILNTLQSDSEKTRQPTRPELQLPSYHGKKVLVVEDNKINQKVITARLAKLNIVPDLAENGQIALNKLTHNRYDLIFMDCHMPIKDGYATTRELRILETSQGFSRQTVIALTANAMEGERKKCLAAGMDDYLTKPIVSEQFTAILAEQFGLQTTERTPPIIVENNLPVSVWDTKLTLNSLDSDNDLLNEMIALFIIESPKQLSELLRAQETGNLLALTNAAHAIKGTVAHFYAKSAKDCAEALERAARSGQSADYQGMTDALVNAVTDLMNHLEIAKNKENI